MPLDIGNQHQMLLTILFGLAAALMVSLIAWLMDFFKVPLRPYDEETPSISTSSVMWPFGILVGVKYLIAPAFMIVGYRLLVGKSLTNDQVEMAHALLGWATLALVFLMSVLLLFYFYVINPKIRKTVWGLSRRPLADLRLGILTWFIAFPWVFFVNHLIGAFMRFYYTGPEIEQVVVTHMRMIMGEPILFALMALSVIIIVPVIEEVLFRGLLQPWLKQKIGTAAAILITSLAFGIVHFADAQGVFNISIVFSLVVLSLFLGYLKERQNSLYAPIGLHSTVNAVSFFIILVQEKFHEVFSSFSFFFINIYS